MAATRGQEVAGRWAVCLPRTAAATLGPLRRLPGVTVHEAHGEVWLRGDGADEALERSLRALPGARRFAVLSDGQLLESGQRVPYGFLPDGAWRPLAQWLEVRLDAAGLAGKVKERVPLRLVRSALVREANVLLVALCEWGEYGREAAQVRLERWSFAVSAAGAVVVRGEPLPPLPGQRFVEVEGVAVPAGWTWEPAVETLLQQGRDDIGSSAGKLEELPPTPEEMAEEQRGPALVGRVQLPGDVAWQAVTWSRDTIYAAGHSQGHYVFVRCRPDGSVQEDSW